LWNGAAEQKNIHCKIINAPTPMPYHEANFIWLSKTVKRDSFYGSKTKTPPTSGGVFTIRVDSMFGK
jgi:hypothetical protein